MQPRSAKYLRSDTFVLEPKARESWDWDGEGVWVVLVLLLVLVLVVCVEEDGRASKRLELTAWRGGVL